MGPPQGKYLDRVDAIICYVDCVTPWQVEVRGIQIVATGAEISRRTLANGDILRCEQEQDHGRGKEKPRL